MALLASGYALAGKPKVLFFLGNFLLSKGAIYLAPLAVAILAQPAVYGAVEMSQSVSLLVASFVVTPALQGLTQHFLIRGRTEYKDITWLLVLLVSLATLLSLAVAGAGGADSIVVLVCASFVGAGLHVIGNSTALMLGARNVATWTAGTNILIVAVLVGLLLATRGEATVSWLSWSYVLIAVAMLLVALVALLRSRQPELWFRLKRLSAVGLPMVLVGGLSIWLSVGGRITIGLFNASALPAYGVAFRIAGLLLGIHQLAMTAFFVSIYRGRVRTTDQLMAAFMLVVLVSGAAICFAAPWIAAPFAGGALDTRGTETFVRILPPTTLHTFYWIGLAMLQLRVNRFGIAGAALLPTATATVGGVAITVAIALLVSSDVVLLSWLLAAHAALLFFVTAAALRWRRLPHRLMEKLGVFGGLGLALIAGLALV